MDRWMDGWMDGWMDNLPLSKLNIVRLNNLRFKISIFGSHNVIQRPQ